MVVIQQLQEDVKLASRRVTVSMAAASLSRLPKTNPLCYTGLRFHFCKSCTDCRRGYCLQVDPAQIPLSR